MQLPNTQHVRSFSSVPRLSIVNSNANTLGHIVAPLQTLRVANHPPFPTIMIINSLSHISPRAVADPSILEPRRPVHLALPNLTTTPPSHYNVFDNQPRQRGEMCSITESVKIPCDNGLTCNIDGFCIEQGKDVGHVSDTGTTAVGIGVGVFAALTIAVLVVLYRRKNMQKRKALRTPSIKSASSYQARYQARDGSSTDSQPQNPRGSASFDMPAHHVNGIPLSSQQYEPSAPPEAHLYPEQQIASAQRRLFYQTSSDSNPTSFDFVDDDDTTRLTHCPVYVEPEDDADVPGTFAKVFVPPSSEVYDEKVRPPHPTYQGESVAPMDSSSNSGAMPSAPPLALYDEVQPQPVSLIDLRSTIAEAFNNDTKLPVASSSHDHGSSSGPPEKQTNDYDSDKESVMRRISDEDPSWATKSEKEAMFGSGTASSSEEVLRHGRGGGCESSTALDEAGVDDGIAELPAYEASHRVLP
ncbi:hypothetical protein BJ742DRAFT_885184 [Cladochytrium replicatum]|nr:hypothetical protein BJ742DRAFT_885184 [Cladochytrium replicatum]